MATFFGDLAHAALAKQSFVPGAARTADGNGVGCDMSLGGGGNSFNALLNMGVYDVGSGNESYAITITESDDDITYSALATPVSFTTKTAAGGDDGSAYVEMVQGIRSKKYLRAELDVGGTTPSCYPVVTFFERKKITGTGDGSYSA